MPFDRNNMTITKAALQEFDAVRAFYFEVIEAAQFLASHSKKVKD